MSRKQRDKLLADARKADAMWKAYDQIDGVVRWIKRRWAEGVDPNALVQVSFQVKNDRYNRSGYADVPAALVGGKFLAALQETRKITKAGLDAWEVKP